jgi:hypothetical protein
MVSRGAGQSQTLMPSRSLIWTRNLRLVRNGPRRRRRRLQDRPSSTLCPIRPHESRPRLKGSRRLSLPTRLLKHGNRGIFLPLRELDGMDNRRRGPSLVLPYLCYAHCDIVVTRRRLTKYMRLIVIVTVAWTTSMKTLFEGRKTVDI